MSIQNSIRQSTIAKLKQVDSLPALPGRFHLLQKTLSDPTSSLTDLTVIIEADQAIVATILKVANSVYYNPLGRPVNNLPYAISRLGRKEAGDIALSMALLSGIPMPASITIIQQFWSHAFAVGQISRLIVASIPDCRLEADTIFLSSLLHDIGRAILGIRIDANYFKSNLHTLNGQELIQAEIEAYGTDHAEVGEIILKHWRLPSETFEVVGSHHNDAITSLPCRICIIANDLANQYLHDATSIEEVQNKLKDHHFILRLKEKAQERLTAAS